MKVYEESMVSTAHRWCSECEDDLFDPEDFREPVLLTTRYLREGVEIACTRRPVHRECIPRQRVVRANEGEDPDAAFWGADAVS